MKTYRERDFREDVWKRWVPKKTLNEWKLKWRTKRKLYGKWEKNIESDREREKVIKMRDIENLERIVWRKRKKEK